MSEKTEKGKSKVKNIILYGISIFLTFMGLVSGADTEAFGWLLIILAGLTLFPPFHGLLKKFGAPRIIYNLFFLVSMSLVLFLVGASMEANDPAYQEQLAAKEAAKPKTYSFYKDGSDAQRYLIDLIDATKAKISENDNITRGKEKFYWIETSKNLCSSEVFNVNGLQRGWLGQLYMFSMRDNGGMQVTFNIGTNDNKVTQTFKLGEAEKLGLQVPLLDMEEKQLVYFSGQFVKGKISENECLRAGIDSNPELEDESFQFKFARIELL